MMNGFRNRVRALFRRDNEQAELTDELQFHVDRQIEKYMRSGLTEEEARRRARLDFGGLDGVTEECRDEQRFRFFETVAQDVRYGLRVLRKKPAFTAIAVLTLALGIGASTAVFTAVDTILIKPLPYPNSDRIMALWWKAPITMADVADEFPWAPRDFVRFGRETKAFESLGAFKSDFFNLVGAGEPARLDGLRASTGYFSSLGVAPELGRTFAPEEDQPGHEFEVILSDALWRERFGADQGVLGQSITLNGRPYTVVGVMPRGFSFPRAEEMPVTLSLPARIQVWVPLAVPANAAGGPNDLGVIGKFAPQTTARQALEELRIYGARTEAEFPTAKGWYNASIVSLSRQSIGDTRRPLLLLLGAVGIVLLISSSNVGSLVLTRSLGRTQEFALRGALGAGPGRLMRQLLTESLVLAGLGGLAGLLVAQAALAAVKVLGPSSIPRLGEMQLDFRVLAFTIGVAFFSAILFGLGPLMGAPKQNLAESLNEGGQRSSGGTAHHRVRNAFLISEVALAFVLVVSTGLLVRTVFSMSAADAGFVSDGVLTFQVSLPSAKYAETAQMTELYRRLLEAMRVVPGVASAGLVSEVPMGGATDGTSIRIPEHPRTSENEHSFANYLFASPGYFSTLGTPLIRGRDFLATDTLASPHVTVINRSMAEKYWPGEDPIGKEVGVESTKWPTRVIVGIVADVKRASLREDPDPEMYVPYTQNEIRAWPSMQTMQVALRSEGNPAQLTPFVRDAMRNVDPDLPMSNVATLAHLVDNSMVQWRFSLLLVGSFGGLALAMAMIGIYGVMSVSVQQQTRAIGIRVAMGATRENILRMILVAGAKLAATGVVIGLLTAWTVTRAMEKFLYGVRPTDPVTFATVSSLLMVAALIACLLPALHATRVDPLVALRSE